MNLFHAFVWLDKTMKLLMKNHKIRPTGSSPFSKVNVIINIMNLFHAFLWLNKAIKLLMKNSRSSQLVLLNSYK